MKPKNYSRRDFIGKTSVGIAGIAVSPGISLGSLDKGKKSSCKAVYSSKHSTQAFTSEVERLPVEDLYDYHKHLSTAPIHVPRRDRAAKPGADEMIIPGIGWKLIWDRSSLIIGRNAVEDFQDYLDKSQDVKVEIVGMDSLAGWKDSSQSIIAGTREQLPGRGLTLKGPKDYEIVVTTDQVIVCGYDEHGVMFGLYNLEARMNLREGPFLPMNLKTVRHSLYDTRMVLSWMGWMEFPDQLLSHLAHDGIDGIFASVYANPNGDRTTAETSTDFYARLLYRVRRQDPARVRDIVNRAARYGIKVYTQICYQYLGTPESEAGLRKLVREIVGEFPDIRGYILLTEGFWYGSWREGRGKDEASREWARNWCRAVAIVTEECHKIDPSIEILPWEYNIPNRPDRIEMKKYYIQQLPGDAIPMPTWENGKSFELGNMTGYLTDYSLNQVGPAEVTIAQVEEARKRGMKVYTKADTFASWQYGTIPYLPCPYQWYDRYMALEDYGVKGTLESWSSGYKPNFVSELRAWTCWSDAPPRDELFGAMASRIFGKDNRDIVLKAWDHFSRAIRLIPDTGAHMGTNNAIGNPLFFQKPPRRIFTRDYSWGDPAKQGRPNSYWPFTVSRMVFYPDFTNRMNRAENYARSRAGVQVTGGTMVLPVFLDYLRKAIDQMEEGLSYYREAVKNSPPPNRQQSVREVVVAEQMQRMMQSAHAILEFEDLRLQHASASDRREAVTILDRMEEILRDEILRTELSLLAATRDSRLGFQFEQDYVYTPYSLEEKLGVLHETLDVQIPAARIRI